MVSVKNLILTVYKNKILYLFLIYDVLLTFIYLIFQPNLLGWLFDDLYTKANRLLHFIDFRPGYPPLGKLLYTLIYYLFAESNMVAFLIILYNAVVLDVMLYILYRILSELSSSLKVKILTLIVALNPIFIMTVTSVHADFLALSFSLACIYTIMRRKPLQTGFLCGLGFLTKIYPSILLVPSLMIFQNGREKLELLSSFILIVVLVSSPFLVLDPLMYTSVFIHHLLRGPSESIFALLDGYYSHTGFLHPTYEATIYADQFVTIYPSSTYDHFRYMWNIPYLKYISLSFQLFFTLYFSLMATKERRNTGLLRAISLATLSYFTFSTFWNPLVALPVFLLVIFVILERNLVYQLIVLTGFIIVDTLHYMVWFPGLLTGIELSLLIVVIFRAILLSIVFLTCYPNILKKAVDIKTILLVLMVILLLLTFFFITLNLYSFVKTDTTIIDSSVEVVSGSLVKLEIPRFDKHDRIYLILNANTPVHLDVNPRDALVLLPLDVEGMPNDIAYPIISSKGFFYVANSSESAQFLLNPQPKIPFFIKDFEGKVDLNLFKHSEDGEEYVGVELKACEFAQNGFCQLLLIYPYMEVARPNFLVNGTVKLLHGKIAYINFILMTDNAWYAFNIAPHVMQPNSTAHFSVHAGKRELFGRDGEFLEKKVLFVALGIGLHKEQYSADEPPRAVIAVGKIDISNGGTVTAIKPKVLNRYDLKYRIYVLHKFKLTLPHAMLVTALTAEVCAIFYLALKLRNAHLEES